MGYARELAELATAYNTGNPLTHRNKIINGGMVLDQRNAGASITPTATTYFVDRFYGQMSQASKFSAQQNAGSVTPPAGFTNYLGITSLSAYSITASDYFNIGQNIEGYNIADLGWGSANAKTVTLSFWVRSSLTGTFGVSFRNNDADRNYQASYTVSSANTWEQKTITVAGDTAGTWTSVTNGTGLRIGFGLGVGSDYSTTAGSWGVGNKFGLTGATSVVGTSGATLFLTGVQLEVGSNATGFEYRMYNQELAMCQRYCYSLTNTSGGNGAIGISSVWTNNTTYTVIPFPVTMRALPSMSAASASTFKIYSAGTTVTPTSIDLGNSLTTSVEVACGVAGTPFTPAYSNFLRMQSGAYLNFTAEL